MTPGVMRIGCVVLAGACCGAAGQDESAETDAAALIEAVRGSAVRVEHTLRYHNGEAPEAEYMSWPYQRAEGDLEGNWASLIRQERPDVRMGFVIGPDRVVISDPLVHDRFVERVAVRVGDRVVGATAEARATRENALLLRLDEPIDVPPLDFDPGAPGPYSAVWARYGNGEWWFAANGIAGSVHTSLGGEARHGVAWPSVLVGEDGTPVSMTFDGGLEFDGSWREAPADWAWVSDEAMRRAVSRVEEVSASGLPRVELRFRSPAQSAERGSAWGGGFDDEITEWNGTGVVVGERRVLVLAQLEPKLTARLDAIRVRLPGGEVVDAQFAGSLRDYAAFMAETTESIPGAVEIADVGFEDVEDRLLVRSEVRVLGETRTAYAWPVRLPRAVMGFRGLLFPLIGNASPAQFGTGDGSEVNLTFVFDLEGRLVGLPLVRRDRVSSRDDWRGVSRASYSGTIATGDLLLDVLGAGGGAIDPENRPLSESEEHRLAWLGVELQAMDPDLARFNGVADLTNGGETGGIVTYVYAGSPAAEAGIEVGDVLLRLHVEGEPRPIEVQVSRYDMGWGGQFSEALDQIDLEYFDQIPVPWGGAETTLTRALTDVGFGTDFVAEVFRDGAVARPEFKVVQGPPHFHAAEKFKSEAMGLTVRNLTYEVRRFFQLGAADPGVIVGRVEQGSAAAVSGIKPYELIVSVNDEPVHSVGAFEAAVSGGGELRFGVKRMHVGRIVRINLPTE